MILGMKKRRVAAEQLKKAAGSERMVELEVDSRERRRPAQCRLLFIIFRPGRAVRQ
jgi:hypothetical protein